MRTVTIPVRNSQVLELFTEKRKDGFEFWIIAAIGDRRLVMTHYLTHDDVEERLQCESPADLVWRNTSQSEIPSEKHPSAIEWEDTIKRGTYVDFSKDLQQTVASHLGGVNLLPIDRKVWNTAKKAIIGRWTDGVATVAFNPDSSLELSCPLDQPHLLNLGLRIHGHRPDWWGFARWCLHLMNRERKCGFRLNVLHVREDELHLGSDQQDRIAHTFRRVS